MIQLKNGLKAPLLPLVRENPLSFQRQLRQTATWLMKRSWYDDGDYLDIEHGEDHRDLVRRLLRHAIAAGDIEVGEWCEHCGSGWKIEGHHVDYNKPLQVVWLCKKCHVKLHAEHRQWRYLVAEIEAITEGYLS